MARRLKIVTSENTYIHIDAEWADYTICGLEIAGDKELGIKKATETQRKANCPTCIKVIKFCKSIDSKEYI